MLDAGDDAVAIEASSHGSHFRRLDRVRFDALVFTNLTQEHLDLHGDMEEYFQAKRRLFTGVTAPPAAVNVGDPYGRRLADELEAAHRAPLVTFGLRPEAEVRAERLELGPHGSTFTRGGHRARDAAARASSTSRTCSAPSPRHCCSTSTRTRSPRGSRAVAGVAGRFEAIDEGQDFAVVVDYAHKPDALEAVLRAARALGDGRLTVVFGAGGDRDRDKRPEMGRVARQLADSVIVTSDNPRSEDPLAIIGEILAGRGHGRRDRPRPALGDRDARSSAPSDGDVVVIAGKGHEQGQEIAGVVHPFDDREVARDALRALRERGEGACDSSAQALVRRSGRVIPLGWDEIEALGSAARRAAGGRRGPPRPRRLARRPARATSSSRSTPASVRRRRARARRRALVPDDQQAALAALARARPRPLGRAGRRRRRLDGEDVDEGRARRALRGGHADGRGRGEPEQRDRPAAHGARLEPETRVLVTEMGMRGLGQIAELCAIARPTVALVTSIGPEHLELVGTVEDVARANAEAIEALPPGGIAVVPADEPLLEPYLGRDRVESAASIAATVEPVAATALAVPRRRAQRSSSSCRSRSATWPRTSSRRSRRTTRSGCRSSARRRARPRSSSAAGAARCASCPAAASSSTTRTTRTRPRCAPRSSTSPSAPAAGGASRSSARWRSSATRAPRYHGEIASAARRARDRRRRRRRRRRARYLDGAAREAHGRRRRGVRGLARRSSARATRCSSRPRAPSGSKASPP